MIVENAGDLVEAAAPRPPPSSSTVLAYGGCSEHGRRPFDPARGSRAPPPHAKPAPDSDPPPALSLSPPPPIFPFSFSFLFPFSFLSVFIPSPLGTNPTRLHSPLFFTFYSSFSPLPLPSLRFHSSPPTPPPRFPDHRIAAQRSGGNPSAAASHRRRMASPARPAAASVSGAFGLSADPARCSFDQTLRREVSEISLCSVMFCFVLGVCW